MAEYLRIVLFVMVALPADAVSWKISDVPLVILLRPALPADALFLKVVLAPEATLRMVTFSAVLELLKLRSPVAVTVTVGTMDDELAMPPPRNW